MERVPMAMPRLIEFTSDNEEDCVQFELDFECGLSSPHRTRSGKVYTDLVKGGKRKRRVGSIKKADQGDAGDMADCEENNEDDLEDCYRLPPLTASRVFSQTRERRYQHDLPSSPAGPSSLFLPASSPRRVSTIHYSVTSSPVQNSSPPNCSLDMLDILSPTKACTLSSPHTQNFSSSVPRSGLRCSRLRFDSDGDLVAISSSLPSQKPRSPHKIDQVKSANINPFTPQAIHEAAKRKFPLTHDQSYSPPCWAMSQSYSDFTISSQGSSLCLSPAEEFIQDTSLPAKRLRVSDISSNRYQEEFVELSKLANGQFGEVNKARHRLDGIVYAIKITKKNLRANSYDEKMAMNEVFAHAALMKHKHVVRYFNSWVEQGKIFIQNEFCEGGSLEEKIESCRVSGKFFPEEELCRLLLHVGKGLKYIHSRQLVHLDIKPANILVALYSDNYDLPASGLDLSDSGAASGECRKPMGSSRKHPAVQYKIGDLGHMNSVQGGDISPTEGDCRYMAPEFLQMDSVDSSQLTKADMFSTGMTLYEAASLDHLPRNSEDSPNYEKLKQGFLPYLHNYSNEIFSLLRCLVKANPAQRITASKLISKPILNPKLATKSKSQLVRELHQAKAKILELEIEVSGKKGGKQGS